jgi:signal recognition particle subunit SRP54
VIVMAGPAGLGQDDGDRQARKYLREQHGSSVAVAACDVYRPAAVEQLIKVGAQAGADVYEQGTDRDPVKIAAWARDRAQSEGKDVLIVDTSGRLHVDEELMKELAEIKKAVRPDDVLLVVDAMTGQDAVNVAEQFAEAVDFDGRDHEQARRRRARRRRAVGQGGHRQADPVRLDRREARPVRALPPRPDGAADPRHGRRDDA